jgi:hypothetical protein
VFRTLGAWQGHSGIVTGAIRGHDFYQLARIADEQIAKEDCIDQAEDGGVRANAEGEG